MSARILDGAALSKETRANLKVRVDALISKGVSPRLDVIVASQDPASEAYVRMKMRWAEAIGIEGERYEISERVRQEDLIQLIFKLNANPNVHGVLIQHPLPGHLDEQAALLALGPEKDVDGITPASLGRLTADLPGFRCATPLGLIRLMDHYEIPLEGKRALVIGRSVILGKPAALMLLQRNATVTIAHSRSVNLPDLCKEADIVVAAVGRPEMILGEWLKPGCVVIDAGYNKVEGRGHDVGDCEFESCSRVAEWITPVPGGVGPMTVATLLSNAVDAAEAQNPGL